MKSLNTKLLIFLSVIAGLLILELTWWVIFVHRITDEHNEISVNSYSNIEFLANHFYSAAEDKRFAKKHILDRNPELYFDGHKFLIDQNKLMELDEYTLKNKRMFIYESAAFLVLIIVGFVRIYKSLNRELEVGQQQHNFMLSITHELKTPLASIKLFLQTIMSRKNLSEDRRDKFLHNSISEVERLNTLVDNILQSVKLERNPKVIQEKAYPLASTISQSLSKFKLHGSSVNIIQELDENIRHNIHPDMIAIIINNLVGNAIKYNKEVNINISLTEKEQFIHFIVSDNGSGIPEYERDKIFDRFYRVGEEETREASGTGLGLYIVKKIVMACNGTISCLENKPKGTLFLIKLPFAKEH